MRKFKCFVFFLTSSSSSSFIYVVRNKRKNRVEKEEEGPVQISRAVFLATPQTLFEYIFDSILARIEGVVCDTPFKTFYSRNEIKTEKTKNYKTTLAICSGRWSVHITKRVGTGRPLREPWREMYHHSLSFGLCRRHRRHHHHGDQRQQHQQKQQRYTKNHCSHHFGVALFFCFGFYFLKEDEGDAGDSLAKRIFVLEKKRDV